MKFLKSNKAFLRIGQAISERKRGLQFLLYNVSGNSLTLLLNFALPFFLSNSGYGYFALLFSIYNLFAAIFTFGLDSTILKFSFNEQAKRTIVARCFYVWLFLSVIAFIVLIPIVWFVASQDILKASFSAAMLTIFSAFLVSFQRIILFYYIAKETLSKYGTLFIFNKFFQAVVFIVAIFILTEQDYLIWIPYLFIIQSAATVLLLVFLQRRQLKAIHCKKEELQSLIKFTLPLTLETVGNIGYSYGFNLLISPFLNLAQLGVLNLYTQFGSMISMTTGAFNNGFLPRFFKQIDKTFKDTVKKYGTYIFTNTMVITFGIFIVGVLYSFFNKMDDTNFTIQLLFVYLSGIFLYSFKAIGSSYLIHMGQTIKIAVITIVSSVLNIGLGMIMTGTWGFDGCIIGLTLGYGLQVILFNFDVLKRYLTTNTTA